MMDVCTLAESLERRIFADGYKGYDPYDALGSPILNNGLKWPEIAATQFFRRCPINFRKIFFIKKDINPKSLGLLLTSYANLHRIGSKQYSKDKVNFIVDYLDQIAYRNKDYLGWGYNFTWRNRNFKLPKYSPTSVNTAFIVHGLLDILDLPGVDNESVKRLLHGGLKCFDDHFNTTSSYNGGECISYSSFDNSCVHNANLLVAGARFRSLEFGNDVDIEKLERQLKFTLDRVESTGRLEYGTQAKQRWADSFHTGFVLEQLLRLEPLLCAQAKSLYHSMKEYYLCNYFGKSGEPFYYEKNGVFDIHSPAQAIRYMSLVGDYDLSTLVFRWTLDNMCSDLGDFYFRKNKFFTNKIIYMRWSQVWMLYALTTYSLTFES